MSRPHHSAAKVDTSTRDGLATSPPAHNSGNLNGSSEVEVDIPGADLSIRPLDSIRMPKSNQARSDFIHHRFFALGDVVAIGLAALLAATVGPASGRTLDPPAFAETVALLVPFWFLVAYLAGLYHDFGRRIDQNFVDEVSKVAMTATIWCWGFVLVRSAVVVGETDLLSPALMWIFMIPLLLASRALVRSIARRNSWNTRAVAILGDPIGVAALSQRIDRHREWGLEVQLEIAIEEDRFLVSRSDPGAAERNGTDSLNLSSPGLASQRVPQQIANILKSSAIDRVFIAGGTKDLTDRIELVHALVDRGITVDQVSGGPETLYSSALLQHLEGLTVMTMSPSRIQPVGSFLKRAIDITVAFVGLLVLTPLLAVTAMAIKLGDRGPAFFRQDREGRGGETFQILKFRTMVEGADDARYAMREESICGTSGMLKVKDDKRVTKAGRRLRKSSIDELPQLWNVLTGDMSLVGPRPLPLDEAEQINDGYSARTRVRPGITGPWQVMGRSDIPMEDMIKLDYTYVVGWTLMEDFRLLLRTASAVTGRKGVY